MPPSQVNLAQVTFGVGFIVLLAGTSLWIMRPFLVAIVWASTIVIATWPVLLRLQGHLGGRRVLAAALMTFALVLVFVVPLVLGISTVSAQYPTVAEWLSSADTHAFPEPPAWLAGLPLVGGSATELWNTVARDGVASFRPYAGEAVRWGAVQLSGIGRALVHVLLTVVIAAILYVQGEAAAGLVRGVARRLGGERGDRAVLLAGQTIRGVAMGVVITAAAQSLVGGISLAITGVPFAGLLTALMFLLAIAQLGTLPVLAPAVIWMYWTGDTVWATVLLGLSIVAGTMDNFLRPFLIRRGADLPLLLILVGVIGGLVAFGLVGIFIGPVVLAVAYRELEDWVAEAPSAGP